MRKEYDFTNAERGKFYRPKKIQKTLRLDEDIIEYFQKLSEKKKMGYQTLINAALRDSISHPEGTVDTTLLRKELKSTIKSVLVEAQIIKA